MAKRRRRFRKKRSHNVTEGGEISTGRTAWKWPEQQRLWHFLEAYLRKCEQVYYGETIQLNRSNDDTDVPQMIGQVLFPAVTVELCQRPYVALSDALTPSQRRLVHQACAEIGIFHTTTGTESNKRIVYISAYEDGLPQEHDNDSDKDATQPQARLYKYRPWFCRRKFNDLVSTQPPIAIDQLLDQPGDCLRDGVDDMDLCQKWELADLSQIPPPHCDNSNHRLLVVDTVPKLRQCQGELTQNHPTEIAFDVEVHNVSRSTQLTCLIQLAVDNSSNNAGGSGCRTYVIDPLASLEVWDAIGDVLRPFFADPTVVKVGHSIGGLDVQCLHRDFGIFIVNAFDTYEAARGLDDTTATTKLKSHGLAAVCLHYGMPQSQHYTDLKSRYQNCDWRERPLTADMILYARYDVHYLLALRRLLMRDLVRPTLSSLWATTTATAEEKRIEEELVGKALSAALDSFQQWEDMEENGGCVVAEDASETLTVRQRQQEEEEQQGKKFEMNLSMNDDTMVDSVREVVSLSNNNHHDNHQQQQPSSSSSRIPVNTLRLQPDLMRVISLSQQRCRSNLWKCGYQEGIPQNHRLRIHYAQQARRKGLPWTVATNEVLLEKLMNWRKAVAVELECLPGFVVPIELLFPMALHQPTTDAELRRIAIDLPTVLAYNEVNCRQSLFTVIREFIQSQPAPGNTTRAMAPPVMKHADIGVVPRENGKRRRRPEDERQSAQHKWTVMVSFLTLGAIIGTVGLWTAATRRRR